MKVWTRSAGSGYNSMAGSCKHSNKPLLLLLWFYSLLLDLGRFFSSLILYTVGRTPWTGDQPVARPLPTHRTTQTPNKRTEASMSRVGFEPTIPVFEFERAKTAVTVMGSNDSINRKGILTSWKNFKKFKFTKLVVFQWGRKYVGYGIFQVI
jgi:hypothetical protein